MTRTTALSFAAAVGFAATLAAQTTTGTTATTQRDRMTGEKNEITITGCLSRAADGKYLLSDAHMNKSTASTTTGTTTTGTTGSEVATGSKAEKEHNMTWRLEGGSDLDRHVGHKVEVTGRSDWKGEHAGSSASSTSGTTGTTTDNTQPRLDVSSVKMISSSCS